MCSFKINKRKTTSAKNTKINEKRHQPKIRLGKVEGEKNASENWKIVNIALLGKSDMKFEISVKFKIVYRDFSSSYDFFEESYKTNGGTLHMII